MPKRLIPSIPEEESFEQTLVPEQQPTQQTAYEEPQEQEYEPEVDETELEDDEEDEPVYVKSAKKQPKKGKEKPSRQTLDKLALACGLNGIVQPVPTAVQMAADLELQVQATGECCAF